MVFSTYTKLFFIPGRAKHSFKPQAIVDVYVVVSLTVGADSIGARKFV